MFYAACGSPGQGKTFLVRNWLLPTLAMDPAQLTGLHPPDGFGVILVADPYRPATGYSFPDGQRFSDVAEWRRASNRELLCCFDRPHYEEMMHTAWELATEHRVWSILVFDELASAFPSGGGKYRDGDIRKLITVEGRHYGIAVIGCALRLGDVHIDARKALQGVWISDMSEPGDRTAAGEIMRNRNLLDELQLKRFQFLEFNREFGRLNLIRIVNGRRVVEKEL